MVEKYPSSDKIVQKPKDTGFLARVGRLGTRFETSDQEARTFGVRRLAVIGMTATVALAAVGLYKLDENQTNPLEDCVRDKTGEIIKLDINPKSGEIMTPGTMNDIEQAAYQACVDEQ